MRNILKAKNNLKNYGFTLLEVIVVIIILSILAAVAFPRYTGALEKSRAAEGVYALGTILSSMERYYLENGQFPLPNQVLTAATGLDIDPPALKNFNPAGTMVYGAVCGVGSTCASVARSVGGYWLGIDRNGTISCVTSPPGIPSCQDAGY